MSKHEPLYLREFAEWVGLDENRWDVAISKQKGTGGTTRSRREADCERTCETAFSGMNEFLLGQVKL